MLLSVVRIRAIGFIRIFVPMTVIRLTKEFSFEAAHALDGYDGPCREVHGHSLSLIHI